MEKVRILLQMEVQKRENIKMVFYKGKYSMKKMDIEKSTYIKME